MNPIIQIRNLTKYFENTSIMNGLDLDVYEGEFLTIIGRSGEGKSVLLKQIMGLLQPDAGSIIIDGVNVTMQSQHAIAHISKTCGYVFQFAALLDSLSVFENVGIALLEQNQEPEKVLPLVVEKLEQVGLGKDILYKYPNELSGGMKKRVGLARTLMLNPKIIIYDEPTTGLDPISVRVIHELIKQTQQHNVTTIVISHDIEIFKFTDRVAMLHQGRIIYTGCAQEIWQSTNPYVHQFIRGLIHGPIDSLATKQ